MQKAFIEHTRAVTKINVSPIIDVALVLVIILMVTAPMIAVSDIDVNLPPAETRSLDGVHRIMLTIGRGGELSIDDIEVNHAGMASVLSARLSEHDDAVLVVRADETVPFTAVESMIEECKAMGAKRIAIATRQRGGRTE
jgi:biopolymer transport protein TolR